MSDRTGTTMNNTIISSNNEVANKVIIVFECEICHDIFYTKAARSSHMRHKHVSPQKNISCTSCGRKFSKNGNLTRHKLICKVNNDNVLEKSESVDNIVVEEKNKHFSTYNEFSQWKEALENKQRFQFTKVRGTKRNISGNQTMYFRCHRNGVFHSKSTGSRHIKLQGTNKTGYCPAKMNVTVTREGKVIVKYTDTHSGHPLDLGRMCISKAERAAIANKIALNVPFQQILDEVRDTVIDGKLERKHLITRKDLWNIATSYNLNSAGVLHKNDFLSVEAWVKYMQETSNVVRFYKPQGCIIKEYSELKTNDFFLIIMNDAQLEILTKFGNDIISIDGTHGLNAYDFQLYTILVLDDMRQGFPACFLFSNRGDTVAMQLYFSIIKVCLSQYNIEIVPKSFMSDMDVTFYCAWSAVFGPVENQLWCSWHVDRAFRSNLKKIRNKEKQILCYKKLKIITFETDENTFFEMRNNYLKELMEDPETKQFATYIEQYLNNPKTWAYVYRKQCGLNTNMHLESMHKVIKHLYFNGKKVKRMDKAIYMLMKFIRDRLFNRLITQHKGKLVSKISELRKRHKTSMALTNKEVTQCGTGFNISSDNNKAIYQVEPTGVQCNNCNLYCEECATCIHKYSCTCVDYIIKWNMCKHIHFICTLLIKQNLDQSFNQPLEQSRDQLIELDQITANKEESAILKEISVSSFEKRKLGVLKTLENITNLVHTIENEDQLLAVSKQLAPIETLINTYKQENIVRIPAAPKILEPANKNISPQLRFISTKKKTKSKEQLLRNPNNSEKDKLSLDLVLQK